MPPSGKAWIHGGQKFLEILEFLRTWSVVPGPVPGWDEAVVILGRAGAIILFLLVLEQLQDVILDDLLD